MIVMSSSAWASSADTLSANYSRGLNTDLWWGGIALHQSFGTVDVDLSESFRSSRLRVSENDVKWKDQNLLVASISKPVSDHFRLRLLGRSVVFSDKQSGFENDIKTHTLGIGGNIERPAWSAPLFVGVTEDTRFRQTDFGPSYSVGAHLPRVDIGPVHNALEAAFEEDRLRRRRNNTLTVNYLLTREFYEDTNDSLSVSFNRMRRDYYISDAGRIESRLEDEKQVGNILNYRLGPSVRCRFRGGLGSRRLRIHHLDGSDRALQRERRDFDVFGTATLKIRRPSYQGYLEFSYSSEEQEYAFGESATESPFTGSPYLIAPDNQSIYTTLTLFARVAIRPTDSLTVHSSLQRFRYDTPDPDNVDDRDELRYRLDAQYVLKFSPRLHAYLHLSMQLKHYVYIFGQRSADNNWTRILSFSPTLVWRVLPGLRWTHAATVLANYVDYDFESLFPNVRSFLYRKFEYTSGIRYNPSRKTRIGLAYRIELDENGKFLWSDWVEQKLVDRTSHTLTATYTYRPWRTFRIQAGYSLYNRRGYRYMFNPSLGRQREINSDFKTHGPNIAMHITTRRLRASIRASTIATKTLNVSHRLLTRIDATMTWKF